MSDPYYSDPLVTLYLGDCLDVMRELPDESVDAIVTDPPYGLEFMGKEWDRLGGGIEDVQEGMDRSHPFRDGTRRVRFGESAKSMQQWHEAWATEAFRVAKPGAHILAFGGSRTVHRLASAIEDAGWEIRDELVWIYASGFPKSLDVSKAIDKRGGADIAWFGPWLRQERERRGITQKSLAGPAHRYADGAGAGRAGDHATRTQDPPRPVEASAQATSPE